ncbi:MAG TPA: hypothetical protein DDW68_00095 [Verrucomicrobiales bacterium]|nr:hypothetical protein [Verrucomicrobiales bacterium]
MPVSYKADGVSQVAALKGKPVPLRGKPLFWKMGGNKNRADHWVNYAVVHQHWKLVTNNDTSRVELYDLAADLAEKVDVAAQNPGVVTTMLKQLKIWQSTLPEMPTGDVFSAERNAKK